MDLQDFVFGKKREIPWESRILAKFEELSTLGAFMKLAGLNDHPCRLIRGEVSLFSKIYSTILCLASLTSTFQSFVYFFDPSLVPDGYFTLKSADVNHVSKFATPLFSASMSLTRIAFSMALHRKSYLRSIRETTRHILRDPNLGNHVIDMRKIKVIFAIGVLSHLFMVLGCGVSVISAAPSLTKEPMFYLIIFQSFLYMSTFSIAGCYMSVVTLCVITPLLKIATRVFSSAIKSTDAKMLRSAIASHDTCRRLIDEVDEIGSYFLGVLVLNGVPLIATAASNLDGLREEGNGFVFKSFIGFAFLYVSIMTFFIFIASAVHCELTARFQDKSFGFTFFRLITIRKETILSVSGLVTTYVIIAFQMKAC